jgi:aryl-alcohol dehydrogenase-like predicted oxidoreductase
VFPVSAVQLEWSLMTRDVETDVIPAARALGVGIVAYSPLGRGLLSATVAKRDDLASTDWRLSAPRFSEGNLPANAAAAARIAAVAARKGVTPAQVALAWVHARGDDVVPIPGTKTVARLRENVAAVGVHLTPEESAEVEAAGAAVQGARYASAGMAATFNARADL